MFRRAWYLIGETIRTIRWHKGITSISIVIMSLSLLMLAVFLLATDNLLKLVGEAQDEMKLYVYLEDRAGDTSVAYLHSQILSLDEVVEVTFVSKEEALMSFRDQLGEDADLLTALRTNPLPNSFWVTPRRDLRDRVSMGALAEKIEALGGVEEVRYGKEFLDKFSSIVTGVYYVDMVAGLIVIVSAVFIIANAVRLTVISRRKTIEILKLVGATNRFITAPFIMEGAFQGGVAAVLSLVLLWGVTEVSRREIPDLAFFSLEKSLLFMVTCVVIGSLGSFMALRRYLNVK